MKDHIGCTNMTAEPIYKEVVVVGNGPSALGLSYVLSGHLPHYTGNSHPDEMLTARLHDAPSCLPLIHHDLEFLCQGLEGRSKNQMSILLDCLAHPGADTGLDNPPLLTWRSHPDTAVDHVVLGKGPPGGAWQAMDGNVLTISLSSWMELPGLEYRRWEALNEGVASTSRRVRVESVAAYYKDYVRLMGLDQYMRSGVVITSVRPLHSQLEDEREGACWMVQGYDTETQGPVSYVCRSLVLATGSTDRHNSLDILGELDNPSWVFHDLATFETALANLGKDNPGIKEGSHEVDPVCVVGAGLSAADAILAARFQSLPVIHVFRRSAITPERTLPESLYPEYHKVHQMMGARGKGYWDYTALPENAVVEISASPDKKVTTISPSGLRVVHQVSLVAILIGSRPDLSFLPSEYKEGQTLTVDPEHPLDCRSNPLEVDPWTFRVSKAPTGLYAMGPLAGDNFVRFLLGAGVAIARDIYCARGRDSTLDC